MKFLKKSYFIVLLPILILGSCAQNDLWDKANELPNPLALVRENFSTAIIVPASDKTDSAFFGSSVSISGSRAIVGAWGSDNGFVNSGEAYIYERNFWTGQWYEKARLFASNQDTDDRFGYSVSFSGEYAIIGANWADSGGTDRGEAYIFY